MPMSCASNRTRPTSLSARRRYCCCCCCCWRPNRENRVLVFALYKREAARLEQFLQRNNYDAVAVHGDKGQVRFFV